MAEGVPEAMYERQLRAWVFQSQAMKIVVDVARFPRSTFPRKCSSPEEAETPEEAELAMVGGDVGVDDVETTAF